ncbi:MAG TPA: hypothetical protein VGW36_07470 [Pyrinomonadaceae bacterium]|nr:hypothetical protein [Pyrinomonadaceae bacterium]
MKISPAIYRWVSDANGPQSTKWTVDIGYTTQSSASRTTTADFGSTQR